VAYPVLLACLAPLERARIMVHSYPRLPDALPLAEAFQEALEGPAAPAAPAAALSPPAALQTVA
jgi:hypothetical protein